MDLGYIGKRIREKRMEKAWTQEEFAEKINLSPVYIGMIERGEKTPKLETFIRIANVLDVSADELLMDVTEIGYQIRISKLSEEISTLNSAEQQRLFRIIEAYIMK